MADTAFVPSQLASYSGSSGRMNQWLYETDATAATIETAGFFNDAVTYGMKDGDIGVFRTSDETYWANISVSDGVVSLSAFVELT